VAASCKKTASGNGLALIESMVGISMEEVFHPSLEGFNSQSHSPVGLISGFSKFIAEIVVPAPIQYSYCIEHPSSMAPAVPTDLTPSSLPSIEPSAVVTLAPEPEDFLPLQLTTLLSIPMTLTVPMMPKYLTKNV